MQTNNTNNTPVTALRLMNDGSAVTMIRGWFPEKQRAVDVVAFAATVVPVTAHVAALAASFDNLDQAMTTTWFMHDGETQNLIGNYQNNQADLALRAEFLLAVQSLAPQVAVLRVALAEFKATRHGRQNTWEHAYFSSGTYCESQYFHGAEGWADNDDAWKGWHAAPNWVNDEMIQLDHRANSRVEDAEAFLEYWGVTKTES